jgi:hypothetical protein
MKVAIQGELGSFSHEAAERMLPRYSVVPCARSAEVFDRVERGSVAAAVIPKWARAAGYGWLLLDVAAGTLGINQVQPAIAQHVRLGGHIFAGIWIVMASLQGSLAAKLVGLPTGVILFAYTFASPFLPRVWLSPAAILMLVWLAILAWQNGIRPL